jgi:hypothetical protein
MKLQARINKTGDCEKKFKIQINQQITAYYIHPTQSNQSESANGQCCSAPPPPPSTPESEISEHASWQKADMPKAHHEAGWATEPV